MKILIFMILMTLPILFITNCSSFVEDISYDKIAGVWEGRLGSTADDPEAILELKTDRTIKFFIMGLILNGTYTFDNGTLSFTTTNYTSLGNESVITGSLFDDGPSDAISNIVIEGDTFTGLDSDGGNITFTKTDSPFPATAEDLDAMEVTININSTDVADLYLMAIGLLTSEVDSDAPPAAIAFEQMNSNGTGTIKLYIPNESFGTATTEDFMIIALDFDPSAKLFSDNYDIMANANWVSFADWDGLLGQPPPTATLTKNVDITVTMDHFVVPTF